MKTCKMCNGTGFRREYIHVDGGRCWTCGGGGQVGDNHFNERRAERKLFASNEWHQLGDDWNHRRVTRDEYLSKQNELRVKFGLAPIERKPAPTSSMLY